MIARIAVATVSGKAYYFLVTELKRRNVPFLSLKPDDSIPVNVKVVITTKQESHKIAHDRVLEYGEGDPTEVVDEAVRLARGKREYRRLVVGVDPGRSFGVAVLGDGKVVETKNCSSSTDTVSYIKEVLTRTPTTHSIVRIGNGAPDYADKLYQSLDSALSANVVMESVREEGTSKPIHETSNRRGKRDVDSAIMIAQRQGRVLSRGTNGDRGGSSGHDSDS